RATEGKSIPAIAKSIGVSNPTIYRWLKGGVPDPWSMVKFCRYCKIDPILGLVASGVITHEEGRESAAVAREEIKKMHQRELLSSISSEDILNELKRRIDLLSNSNHVTPRGDSLSST
ncbi:helix-turn-helix domain-containing protein, partial [Corynebacterium mastitidis]|uniref:helix-turn-helix domain-containing protein n=1 Tax=Corynebacterium mastitidis TaxID=161890 RepID=UPI001B7F8F13